MIKKNQKHVYKYVSYFSRDSFQNANQLEQLVDFFISQCYIAKVSKVYDIEFATSYRHFQKKIPNLETLIVRKQKEMHKNPGTTIEGESSSLFE